MKLVIRKSEKTDVVTVSCPNCAERVRNGALLPRCSVQGMVFRCRKCHTFWEVHSEN